MKSKEYIYNYVDRVRYAESSFPDYKCPSRGSGWRHNKSISHLDLATSCQSAAAGLNHWSSPHPSRHHQLRHSRSLDYNHIDRCKDALDIAEYYWRVEPEPEIYDEEDEEIIESEQNASQQQQPHPQQLKYVSEQHLAQHYRDFKCADENYHHSTNNIYQSSQQLQQQQHQNQQQQQQQQHQQARQQNLQHQSNISTIPPQPFEFASDSCSLRRSRSLAVIREETFSDLQISSSNGSRRSQLIPRARLVNRGYFRERERLICGNNKHHHHNHTSIEKLTTNCNCNTSSCNSTTGGGGAQQVTGCYCQDLDEQSTESIADTCESHQQQVLHHKQQQQQIQLLYHPHYHESQSAVGAGTNNDYYEHLKRLDKLALGLVTEQLHPWHNDKSDLESLNSDYFKNSLHQTNDFKQHPNHTLQQHSHSQQQQQQHQQQQLDFETFEQAVQLLAQDKPRIYQSRRQKRGSCLEKSHKLSNSTPVSGGESCPENSQSSVFPETTTSNSDDQTDTASLSEQEYDITKIEEIFKKTQIEGDEESYEIISLTTTTHTRIETTEDEAEAYREQDEDRVKERDRLLEEQINGYRFPSESDAISKDGKEDEEEIEDTEDSNRHTTTDTEIEGTLKRSRAVSDNLQKIIAYDSVYLSSEESSDSTLIDVDNCDTSLEAASICTCIDGVETLLHISIEDAIYEPQAKQHKFEDSYKSYKPQDLLSLLEKPQTVSFVETVNTKIEILDHSNEINVEDIKPVYTQILKIEHTPGPSILQQHHSSTIQAGVTSSAASKPKILSVVEKRKLKRYSDSAYSSNVSDSSEKALTSPTTDSSSASSCTIASHLKPQAAEPLYIPLKTNLNDNQYHSLPDVNIGQSLKVSESIDAQLRSSYNLDNCCSLDDDAVSDCDLQHESDHTTSALLVETHSNCSSNNSNRKSNDYQSREEVVTSEQIYESITRFVRAQHKFKQKQSQEFEDLKTKHDSGKAESSLDIKEGGQNSIVSHQRESTENLKTEDQQISQSEEESNSEEDLLPNVESPNSQQIFGDPSHSSGTYSPQRKYDDSLEKSKDAPDIENFSQEIERRAKEIRASGNRTQLQQIEFANRAKFRLENTLSQYDEIQEETKEIKYNKSHSQTSKNSLFRIVVTDAQNNIIEEESIENFETTAQEEEKENYNVLGSIKRKSNSIEKGDDLLMVRFSKERLKEKPINSASLNSRSSNSFKRVPSKRRRQQYPPTSSTDKGYPQHLSIAEAQKLLLSPKSKERRVLSNQIYRARPVKVITTSSNTTTTTTTTDSFRRNKVKHQSNKMSRPQILQVIDNKRKLENGSSVAANPPAPTTFNTNKEEGTQAENEYLKKVDAVRCYWSKLVHNDLEQQKQQQHKASHEVRTEEQETPNENTFVMQQTETPNRQQQSLEQAGQMSYAKVVNKPNYMENLNESQPHYRKEQRYEEKKQFILGAHSSPNEVGKAKQRATTTTNNQPLTSNTRHQDEYFSFMPSIEIVELDGDKKATIVSAAPSNMSSLGAANEADDAGVTDINEPQFDHIRYKVLKSQQLLRSNVLPRNKKEAQFDGLIQYLQEYSFQELLSNNNVVIVEPVRTKIERPLTTNTSNNGGLPKDAFATKISSQQVASDAKRKQPNNTSNPRNGNGAATGHASGGGIKRHFFYQPVRVNRELYEEELPNPDTVRNVRRFFEEHILPTPSQGLLANAATNNCITTATTKQTSPKTRRARKYRYLTIDTSYGHATTTAAEAAKQTSNSIQRKWDTASLSSGISSGDLSSPCECHDSENNPKIIAAETITNNAISQNEAVNNEGAEGAALNDIDIQNAVHVQDLVRKHNNNNSPKKTRSSALGVPVCSSGIRPRSAIYGSLHKAAKSSSYRDIYEYHIKHPARHESDDNEAANGGEADEDDDDNDLFGDVDGDFDELCDTYYVSNDILRKIRECGSSVTYYGGRVVQTSTSASATAPVELNASGSNGHNFNKTIAANSTTTKMAIKNPTMMTQTQTRARVREIETSCNATTTAASATTTVCNMKAFNKECQFQQKKLHLLKNDNVENNECEMATNQKGSTQINVKEKVQGYTADHNGGAGVTFKLVKSNSCSSRLELAGATDIEPEDTEVVRKMVHHFEASKTKNNDSNNNARNAAKSNVSSDTTVLTINSQATVFCQGDKIARHNNKFNEEFATHTAASMLRNKDDDGLVIDMSNQDYGIKLVTINNHINIAKANVTESTAASCATLTKNVTDECEQKQEIFKKTEEQKMYQSEAKDIHLDNCAKCNKREGGSNAAEKICRNKNVDLAFTFVKQQPPSKSPGINPENTKNVTHIGKQSTSNHINAMQEEQHNKGGVNIKLFTYENMLLPTIMSITKIKNSNKLSSGDLKANEAQSKSNLYNSHTGSTLPNNSSQITVPVEIHCIDNNAKKMDNSHILIAKGSVDEKSFLPLSTTSSVTSVIDKTVVKHYVANDKSIYEKRKYDDIEFEEFEIYDPTKDFEKLIEEEKKRHNPEAHFNKNINNCETQHQLEQQLLLQQHSTTSSLTSNTSQASVTSSMATANSQQTVSSTETETDCYDSLDDKL